MALASVGCHDKHILGRNGSLVTYVFTQMLRHSIRYVPKTCALNQDDNRYL